MRAGSNDTTVFQATRGRHVAVVVGLTAVVLGLIAFLVWDWTGIIGPLIGAAVASLVGYRQASVQRRVIIGPDFIEGPKAWSNTRVRFGLADLDRSASAESFLGYLKLRSRDGRCIVVDASLSREDKDAIRRLVGLDEAT